MTTVAFPNIVPNAVEFGGISNTKLSISPLTGYTQTAVRKGARWSQRLTFNNLKDADRATLMAYLMFMEGQVNRVEVGNLEYQGARGALGTSIEVDGADQAGTTFDVRETSSGTSTISNFLRAGDFFSFDNGTNKELKMCTSDFDLNSGSGTIAMFPEVHTSPANGAAIELASPVGTWLLATPAQSWTTRPGYFSDFSVELLEDIV